MAGHGQGVEALVEEGLIDETALGPPRISANCARTSRAGWPSPRESHPRCHPPRGRPLREPVGSASAQPDGGSAFGRLLGSRGAPVQELPPIEEPRPVSPGERLPNELLKLRFR